MASRGFKDMAPQLDASWESVEAPMAKDQYTTAMEGATEEDGGLATKHPFYVSGSPEEPAQLTGGKRSALIHPFGTAACKTLIDYCQTTGQPPEIFVAGGFSHAGGDLPADARVKNALSRATHLLIPSIPTSYARLGRMPEVVEHPKLAALATTEFYQDIADSTAARTNLDELLPLEVIKEFDRGDIDYLNRFLSCLGGTGTRVSLIDPFHAWTTEHLHAFESESRQLEQQVASVIEGWDLPPEIIADLCSQLQSNLPLWVRLAHIQEGYYNAVVKNYLSTPQSFERLLIIDNVTVRSLEHGLRGVIDSVLAESMDKARGPSDPNLSAKDIVRGGFLHGAGRSYLPPAIEGVWAIIFGDIEALSMHFVQQILFSRHYNASRYSKLYGNLATLHVNWHAAAGYDPPANARQIRNHYLM